MNLSLFSFAVWPFRRMPFHTAYPHSDLSRSVKEARGWRIEGWTGSKRFTLPTLNASAHTIWEVVGNSPNRKVHPSGSCIDFKLAWWASGKENPQNRNLRGNRYKKTTFVTCSRVWSLILWRSVSPQTKGWSRTDGYTTRRATHLVRPFLTSKISLSSNLSE